MRKIKTLIHDYRKSRPNAWMRARQRKLSRPVQIIEQSGRFIVAGLVAVLLLCAVTASCSSHHYFSINAEEITNPSILYSDSTSLTNPF